MESIKPLEYIVCPQEHAVPYRTENVARDFSEGVLDADSRPMFEVGFYCSQCNRAYGISKLREPKM